MIITISGRIGAGKSTVAPIIAKALGYESIYMGGIFREIARERGLSIEDFYNMLGSDPKFEKNLDSVQKNLMLEKDDAVIQGRISFFFARESVKPSINIFLDVAPETGAKRKLSEGSYPGKTADEIAELNSLRENEEREHFSVLYGIKDHLDPQLFDIVCDTTNATPEKVASILLEEIRAMSGRATKKQGR